MRITLLLILLYSVSSCKNYVFNSVQSASGVELNEIPKELRGEWKDTSISIKLTDKRLMIDETTLGLSDSVRIFKCDEYFVLNVRNWEYSITGKDFYSVFLFKNFKEEQNKTEVWSTSIPWNHNVAKKMKSSLPIDFIYVDSMGYVTNGLMPYLLDYKLCDKDLVKIEKISIPIYTLNNNDGSINSHNSKETSKKYEDFANKRKRLLKKANNRKIINSVVDDSLYQDLKTRLK